VDSDPYYPANWPKWIWAVLFVGLIWAWVDAIRTFLGTPGLLRAFFLAALSLLISMALVWAVVAFLLWIRKTLSQRSLAR
jgi:hypothetical protein